MRIPARLWTSLWGALTLSAACTSSPTPSGGDASADVAARPDAPTLPADAPVGMDTLTPLDAVAPSDVAAPGDVPGDRVSPLDATVPDGALARQTVGPAGGVVSAPGIRVEIPAGALMADTPIAIRALAPEAPVGDDPFVSPVFALDPPGTVFARPVTVRIDVDRAQVGAGPFGELDSVALLHRAEGEAWEVLGADPPDATVAVGATDSFSRFALVLIRASGCMDPRRLGGVCINTTCPGTNEVCGQRCSVQRGGATYRVTCATPTVGGTRVTCVCDNNGMTVTLRALSSAALSMNSAARRLVAAQYRARCQLPCMPAPDAGVDAGASMDAATTCTSLAPQAAPVDEGSEGFTRPPWTLRAIPPDGTWLLVGRTVNIMTAAAGRASVTVRLQTTGGARTLERVESRTVGGVTTTRTLRGALTFETPMSGDDRYRVTLACDSEGRETAEGEFRYDASANQIHWRWNPVGYGFGETLQRQGTSAPDAGPPRADVVDAGPPSCAFPMQRALPVQGTEIPGTPSSCLTGGVIAPGTYVVTRYTDIYRTVRDYEYLRTWEVGAPRVGAEGMVQDIGLVENSRHRVLGSFTGEQRSAGVLTTGEPYAQVYCATDAGTTGPLTRNVQGTIRWRCPADAGTQRLLYAVYDDRIEVQFWGPSSFIWGETWTRYVP